MAFQKSFFKGSRIFSSKQEQTWTLRCSPCLEWEIVTVLGLSLCWAAWGEGRAPSTQKLLELTAAAHRQSWLCIKAPSSHYGSPAFPHCHQSHWGKLFVSQGEAESRMVKHTGCENRQTWMQILAPPPINCVTLDQILSLSVPQFLDMVTVAVSAS